MESLELLEKKVTQLVTHTQKLQAELAALGKENTSLKKKLANLEKEVVHGNENVEVLAQERDKTKIFVADLIKNIDKLVESSHV